MSIWGGKKMNKLINDERRSILRFWITRFFVLAIFLCLLVWGLSGFRDLRYPYIEISCPADNFEPCYNVYYDYCKYNFADCVHFNEEIYSVEYINQGDAIGERPPFFVLFLPSVLGIAGLITFLFIFRDLEKAGINKDVIKKELDEFSLKFDGGDEDD